MQEVNNLIEKTFYQFMKIHRDRKISLTFHKYIKPLKLNGYHISLLRALKEELQNNINKVLLKKFQPIKRSF